MSKTLLLVDDEADARAIATLALNLKTDWTILQAGSGQEALNISAEQSPDLILLDMMMPEMDGRTTLKKLKADPKTQTIPVILVTAKVQPLAQSQIDPADVVTVFVKPFRPLELADEIRAALDW